MDREQLDLTGLWRCRPDVMEEGVAAGWFEPAHDCRRWREVRVPCTFDRCGPGMASYEGTVWFRRAFRVPAPWEGRRVVCRFHGANYHTRLWVNGAPVGANEDGFLPFEFPLDEELRFGEENVLVVRVNNERRQGEVPGLERGWRPFGGILRPVELAATDRLHLARVRVVAEPADGAGRLVLRVQLANAGRAAAGAHLEVSISAEGGGIVHRATAEPVALPPGGREEVSLETELGHVQPWSPDEPNLYTATCVVRTDDEERDRREVRFGFRRIAAARGRLLLNGEPVFLTGFNRHEDSPRTDMCPDPQTVRRDLERMKRMGCNFVRLCHYPHDPRELDLCDEIGLLAMCEIPLYWWNGLEEGKENCRRKLAAAKRQLTRMIRRDANHPSVVFWSVSNETQEQRAEVAAGNRELIRLAKQLDPTRPAVHVSDQWQQVTPFEEDDVICVNAYPTWFGRGAGEVDEAIQRADQTWRSALEKVHGAFPDKPILVTEFGHPSLEGVFGCAMGEDVQVRAIEAQFAGMDAPYVCGATIWCYADHPWPEEPFIRCLTTSPFGVVTRERRPLQAAEWVARIFRRRQGIAVRSGGRADQRPPGGWPVQMIRPHMRDIPPTPLPDGFSMRAMRPEEIGLWTDIQRDAEQFIEDIDDELFMDEFGDDLEAMRWRCFLLVDADGVALGTISAWYSRDFKGQDYGRIHWFAVRPAYQGRGLGRAALSHAMERLAEWHERAWLATSTGRLAAIKLYLDFGFVPDLEPDGAREAWRDVASHLDHPALKGIAHP